MIDAAADPRTEVPPVVFNELRDASVDPELGDFPGVVGAGNGADPNGPTVWCIEVGSLDWERAVAAQRAGKPFTPGSVTDALASYLSWS